MRILGFELRKLLFHQWGAAIFLICLLAQLGMLLVEEPANQDALLYREGYYHYLDYVSGPYTQEKAAFLEDEAAQIAQAKAGLNTLYREYYAGAVTEDELQSRAQSYQDILRYEDGFDVVYDQYLYICEGKDNRCFLDTNGWTGLLSGRILDLPLVLAVLLLSTPIFCREYACGMDQLALSARNGRKNYVWHKVLMILIAISALCLAGAILRYCFYTVRYGLPHGNYTMQSIEAFGNSKKSLSLLQAYYFLTICRLGGAISLSLAVLAVAALSRQYALTVLLPCALVLLPWLGLPERLQYSTPFPLPFLLGVGLLQGDKAYTDTFTGETVTLFRELSYEKIIWLVVLSVGICFLLLWVIYRQHRTALSMRRQRPRNIAALTLLVSLALSGCSSTAPETDIICFNSHTANTYDYKSYHLYAEGSMLWVENTDTGKTLELVRDPLMDAGQGWIGKNLFGHGNYVYYILTQNENYAGKLADTTGTGAVSCFSVIRVNLDTLEESVIYERQQINTVLGIDLDDGVLEESAYQTCAFFLDDRKLYVLYAGVRCIDLCTGEISVLNVPASSNVAFDGRYIYYVDDRHALCRYDPDDGEITKWSSVAVHDFCLDGDALYYIDMRKGNQLYAMSTDGIEHGLVLDQRLLSIEEGHGELVATLENGEKITMTLKADGKDVVWEP